MITNLLLLAIKKLLICMFSDSWCRASWNRANEVIGERKFWHTLSIFIKYIDLFFFFLFWLSRPFWYICSKIAWLTDRHLSGNQHSGPWIQPSHWHWLCRFLLWIPSWALPNTKIAKEIHINIAIQIHIQTNHRLLAPPSAT